MYTYEWRRVNIQNEDGQAQFVTETVICYKSNKVIAVCEIDYKFNVILKTAIIFCTI